MADQRVSNLNPAAGIWDWLTGSSSGGYRSTTTSSVSDPKLKGTTPVQVKQALTTQVGQVESAAAKAETAAQITQAQEFRRRVMATLQSVPNQWGDSGPGYQPFRQLMDRLSRVLFQEARKPNPVGVHVKASSKAVDASGNPVYGDPDKAYYDSLRLSANETVNDVGNATRDVLGFIPTLLKLAMAAGVVYVGFQIYGAWQTSKMVRAISTSRKPPSKSEEDDLEDTQE